MHEPKSTQAADSDYRFSMEGRKGTDSAQMPFVWAPGWNSNQAIHQFQAHVGGELLHQAPINYVNFDCCMLFINKVLADIKLDSNAVKPAYELVLKTPWYRGEWQASLNPEFTLLHVKNTLIISQSAAATRQWQTGNVVKITTSEEKHFAVIEVAKKRRKKQGLHIHQEALLTLDAIKANSRNDFSENVEITLATADEVERFNDENAQRLQAAENDKKNILKQLQHNDQYIPIRICSGGLNDNG